MAEKLNRKEQIIAAEDFYLFMMGSLIAIYETKDRLSLL